MALLLMYLRECLVSIGTASMQSAVLGARNSAVVYATSAALLSGSGE